MEKFTSLSGFSDITGLTAKQLTDLSNKLLDMYSLSGFTEVKLPSVEPKSLFTRSAGETSDIVKKEMICLDNQSNVLRPEQTAGAVRAYLNQSSQNCDQQRWMYSGSMFRNERPGLLRFKEFRQFGVEGFAIPFGAFDVDLISQTSKFFKSLNLDFTLQLNYLGQKSERDSYCQYLRTELSSSLDLLTEIERARYDNSILRLFDNPNPALADKLSLLKTLSEFFSDKSKAEMEFLTTLLTELDVEYTLDPYLVRGLDYYTGPVFEWISSTSGKEITFAAGGRYDDLSTLLGGPKLPACGLAIGLERLIQSLPPEAQPNVRDGNYFCWRNKDALLLSLKLAAELRDKKQTAIVDAKGNQFGKQVNKANYLNAKTAYFIGTDEIESRQLTKKDLENGTSEKVSLT